MSGSYTPLDISEFIDKLGDPEVLVRPAQVKYEYEELENEEYRTRVHKASSGPAVFSTSKELAVIPQFIWDPNRYYRDLGLVWPHQGVSRRKLRRAYQKRKGYSSNRLTYCFKQLLTPAVREAYDKLPLGERLEDIYVRQELMEKLAPMAAAESAKSGKLTTANDLVQEFDEANPVLNPEQGKALNSSWDWGFYLLGARKYETDDLEMWQSFLSEAATNYGTVLHLSVGYCDDMAGGVYTIREHEGINIVFLNENTQPTLDKAVEAIAHLLSSQKKEISK